MKSNIRVLAITLGMCFAGVGFAATAAPATTASAPAAMAPASSTAKAAAATPAAKNMAAAPAAMAAGGGNGKVWVNDKSKTYHCEGAKSYGKTKTGEYMAEADAKAKGNHAAGGKACAK